MKRINKHYLRVCNGCHELRGSSCCFGFRGFRGFRGYCRGLFSNSGTQPFAAPTTKSEDLGADAPTLTLRVQVHNNHILS